MKLADHVGQIRELIEASFDKQFARLGFGKTKQMDDDKVANLPDEVKAKRKRFIAMLDNHISETGSYESGREKLLDELTFTLFNRLAAIKVMEAANLFPPVLTKQVEHGDRSLGHKMWLEIYPHMRDEELEGIRDYIKFAFDELGGTLPLYSKAYAYALLPDTISLNDIIDRFNAVETDEQITKEYVEGIWNSDDVLGWMYESYNNQKKQDHKDSKDKTEYHKVSLQSQVYTPRWVVQFLVENSLGKMYLEMYPDSEIKDNHKIANVPSTRTRDLKPLHEVKIIDPACGSGNFLLYAFDFFYELYIDQIENYGADYDESDIPKLIIENNLHGIDLDDRAIQLAQLGLFIKAKKKRSSIGEINYNVVSSDFYLPEYDRVRQIFEQGNKLDKNQKELIEKVWSDLQNAYKFGSLVKIDEQIQEQLRAVEERAHDDLFAAADLVEHQSFAENFFKNLSEAVEQYARTSSDTFLTSQTQDAITFLELLTTKYDVAAANPPYTSRREYGPELKVFIDKNYRTPFDTYINLYACFISRLDSLLLDKGKIAMITPMTFMFIGTFEDTRKLILEKYHINLFVQYGFGGIFSESVDPAMYILEKGESKVASTFVKMDMYFSEKKIDIFRDAYEDIINDRYNDHVFKLDQKRIYEVVSHPFIFWISQDFRKKFNSDLLESSITIRQGIATGNNNRFLRFWWEIYSKNFFSKKGGKYIGYAKGGRFNRWAGNLWLMVDFSDKSYENLSKSGNQLPSKQFYFKEGITYSASGRGGYAFRYLPKDHVFDVGGSSMFITDDKTNLYYVLAFLNSKLSFYIADCLNPTANIQVGDLKRVPFVTPDVENEDVVSRLAQQNIELTSEILKNSIVEPTYIGSVFDSKNSWLDAFKSYLVKSLAINTIILVNEAHINQKIFSIYSLSDNDSALVTASQGIDITAIPISEESKEFLIDNFSNLIDPGVLEFIKYIKIRDQEYDVKEVVSHISKGNSIEAVAKKLCINPIDILRSIDKEAPATFNKGLIEDFAFDFLIDIVRECLIEDEDGIIPLVPNSGEKQLIKRIEDKFYIKGFSSAQYSNFDLVLGSSLNTFLEKKFFTRLADRMDLFSYLPKTPFIWHLTSGPEQGFDCYIIIYKWSRDNLMRLRSVYIENRERALQNRQSDIAENESASAQNEKDRIFKQLKEIEVFKGKIDELLEEGYNPVLDDGVGKNIAPLQQKKMLAYDVLNAGQLKKYLNADW